ncbi:MAG: thiamine ABC transporter substrate-binding protein [Micrococcus sp.]|nr:thiamine ABC transporter substrate-binding protein [Micrococcus sp.]
MITALQHATPAAIGTPGTLAATAPETTSPTPSRRARRRRAVVGLAVAGVLALSACSVADQAPRATTSATATATEGAEGEATQAGPTGSGTVTIMTHDSFDLPAELISQFEEESGYTLRTTAAGDSGTVVNQLILAKDSPTVDGVFGVENVSTHTLIKEGVVAEFTPADLPSSAEDLVVDGRMIPIDQGQVCLNYDPAWFEEQGVAVPTQLEQLAEPEYAERTVLTNPVTSSPGLAFLAATVERFGEDEWEQYWEQLLDGGAKIASGWSEAYYSDFSGGEGEGPYPLVLSYSSSPAFAPDTAVFEDTCTPQVEYAGVVEGASNPEGAEAFIDFLLTPEVQAAIPEAMYMYPVDESVELPEEWQANAPLIEDPITPDIQRVEEQRDTWLRAFTELFESR